MRSARTTFSKTGNAAITLDLLDALELSEVLDYLHQWLTAASDDVRVDLNWFGCADNATTTVCRRLTAFTELIVNGQADDDDIYPGRGHDHRADQDQQW
jgi:hypothetical protein